MADDELERLLREVDSALGSPKPTPRQAEGSAPASSAGAAVERGGRGRVRDAFPVAVASGVASGVVVWFLFALLPFVSATSGGLGAFLAGFVVMFVNRLVRRRPPRG
jgi:hypothetical protein